MSICLNAFGMRWKQASKRTINNIKTHTHTCTQTHSCRLLSEMNRITIKKDEEEKDSLRSRKFNWMTKCIVLHGCELEFCWLLHLFMCLCGFTSGICDSSDNIMFNRNHFCCLYWRGQDEAKLLMDHTLPIIITRIAES